MSKPELRESDIKYLRAIISHPDPAVTATEVGDEVGVTQQGAHSKLSDLEERGLVRSKKTGSRSRIWWVTTDGRDAYAESEH